MAFYSENNKNPEQVLPLVQASIYFRRQILHVPDFQTTANTVAAYTGIQEAWIVNMLIQN